MRVKIELKPIHLKRAIRARSNGEFPSKTCVVAQAVASAGFTDLSCGSHEVRVTDKAGNRVEAPLPIKIRNIIGKFDDKKLTLKNFRPLSFVAKFA